MKVWTLQTYRPVNNEMKPIKTSYYTSQLKAFKHVETTVNESKLEQTSVNRYNSQHWTAEYKFTGDMEELGEVWFKIRSHKLN